jgi:large subunit ribosomal protein L32
MGVPKRKTSKSKTGKRAGGQRSRISPSKQQSGTRVDKDTGSRHLSHRVDPETGMYRGRQVLTKKAE